MTEKSELGIRATKKQWQELLDHVNAKDKRIAELERALDNVRKVCGASAGFQSWNGLLNAILSAANGIEK